MLSTLIYFVIRWEARFVNKIPRRLEGGGVQTPANLECKSQQWIVPSASLSLAKMIGIIFACKVPLSWAAET